MSKLQELEKQKNNAYWERNQLVAALSKIFPSFLAKHDINDKEWENDWRTIVVIEIPVLVQDKLFKYNPEGVEKIVDVNEPRLQQLTWHIHDSEVPMFDHLEYRDYCWDGHTTEEKYKRLRKKIDYRFVVDFLKNRYERG